MVERKKPPLDPAPYQAAMRRLMMLVPVCGVVGVAAAFIGYDWRHAVGVAIGALAGWGNFQLLVRMVNSLGPGLADGSGRWSGRSDRHCGPIDNRHLLAPADYYVDANNASEGLIASYWSW